MREFYTFSMIKPHLVKDKKVGQVISAIEGSNFVITNLLLKHLSLKEASEFYKIHASKPFYAQLCRIMSEGSMIAMIIENPTSKDIVGDFRDFIGATNPCEAKKGSIRNLFGISIDYNAIHASDSIENAQQERELIFGM